MIVKRLRAVDKRLKLREHAGPFGEEAGGVLAKGDDVAERGEAGGFLEEEDGVAFRVAFDGGGEAGEAGADNDDFDARGGEAGVHVGR